jgi:hypothetical protein
MKYFIFIIVICFCNHWSIAQEQLVAPLSSETSQKRNKITQQVGFNAMPLLKFVFNRTQDSVTATQFPYIVMYKIGFNKHILRASLGGSYSNEVNQVPKFLDKEIFKKTNIAARLGYERQLRAAKLFNVSLGFDALYNYKLDLRINDSSFDKVTIFTESVGFGGGPMMGLSWNVSKNLSLYTEVAAYYVNSRVSKQTDFVRNPEFSDIVARSVSQKMDFLLPTSLYLIYKF